jgi:hypothetical protein
MHKYVHIYEAPFGRKETHYTINQTQHKK